MGDTVGGDLKSEQYYFSGGYAYRKGSYTIGAEGLMVPISSIGMRIPVPKT